MTNKWIVDVEEDANGNCYITLTDEMLANSGLEIGDTLDWKNNSDGSWTLIKKIDMESGDEKSP